MLLTKHHQYIAGYYRLDCNDVNDISFTRCMSKAYLINKLPLILLRVSSLGEK